MHGLGGNWRSWSPILDLLCAEREVIAVDLPGSGATPPLPGENSVGTLGDALSAFLRSEGLLGIDAVGTSMGARLVLELARRGGVLGSVVALDPGGFWKGWERHFFYASIFASLRVLRLARPLLPALSASPVGRTLLLTQFSSRPWALDAAAVLEELRSYVASPTFDEVLHRLAYGEEQQGAPSGSIVAPLTIAWGRHDRVCLRRQAERALRLFPDAELHWFEQSGHFPHWDQPTETARLILDRTGTRNGLRP